MFFYLSFLRPPPTRAPLFGQISITPQIANDLRTEPFNGAQDIFYSWYLHDANSVPSSISQPTKLTTWRQSSAYKEIPVPLPKGIREGQQYRLVLTTQLQGSRDSINLASEDLGGVPFPVSSMPILFVNGGRGGLKQEQVERVYRFPVLLREEEQANVALRITEQTSFDLDKKIWDSGIGLSSWLVGLKASETQNDQEDGLGKSDEISLRLQRLKQIILAPSSQRILELGAGTGIVALILSILRSSSISPISEGDQIVTTDVESAMPLLEHNISRNAHLFPSISLQGSVLDWDEDLPSYITSAEGGFSLIAMADVTYNTDSFPGLIRTLKRLINLGDGERPCVLLGYKERDEAERTLWDMGKGIGLDFVKVGERKGWGGAPVEIWIA